MLRILIVTLLFMVIDAVWLGLIMKDDYQSAVYNVQRSPLEIRWLPAVVTYLLMAIALEYFVLGVTENKETPRWLRGAVLGLIIYGIFNGTNNAIFKGWDIGIAIKDTMWGTIVFAIVAQLMRSS